MAYTTDQAVQITGATPTQISTWLKEHHFQFQGGPQRRAHGLARKFQLADLANLALLREANAAGFPIPFAAALCRNAGQDWYAPSIPAPVVVMERQADGTFHGARYRQGAEFPVPAVGVVFNLQAIADRVGAAVRDLAP